MLMDKATCTVDFSDNVYIWCEEEIPANLNHTQIIPTNIIKLNAWLHFKYLHSPVNKPSVSGCSSSASDICYFLRQWSCLLVSCCGHLTHALFRPNDVPLINSYTHV